MGYPDTQRCFDFSYSQYPLGNCTYHEFPSSGFGANSCFRRIPSFTRHSTYLGSSSVNLAIWGFTLGAFSAGASLIPGFLLATGADAVIGQYPGPVSAPSLLPTITTSKSFMSAIANDNIPSSSMLDNFECQRCHTVPPPHRIQRERDCGD